MMRLTPLCRLIQINQTLMRYRFLSTVVGARIRWMRALRFINPWHYTKPPESQGVLIRNMLETLGPIYVKFGQVLSTREDLIGTEIALELRKLQDRVPPFDGKQAQRIIETGLKKPIEQIFASFDTTPLASASVAQVHAATLKTGEHVVVKVIRPHIIKRIKRDIAVLYFFAKLLETLWRHGKRLRPREVVREFEQTLYEELDQQREAANASQLKRNFQGSHMMYVPKVYWTYVTRDFMVMERIYGIPLNEMDRVIASGVNLKKLAQYGVEIFFTQVFRDRFFHADMHPGNMFIDASHPQNPRYLGVDFGIMGTLTKEDQYYLASNLLAFFNRDYERVAELHIDCGWVPNDTRVDQFESAIRTVCEPIFERPLADISFATLLLRLFQTAERFNMTIQPQLVLLQKTLLNIEGLGRQLYPQLDLWETAKPFMENWFRERRCMKRLGKELIQNLPEMLEKIIQTPELLYDVLDKIKKG